LQFVASRSAFDSEQTVSICELELEGPNVVLTGVAIPEGAGVEADGASPRLLKQSQNKLDLVNCNSFSFNRFIYPAVVEGTSYSDIRGDEVGGGEPRVGSWLEVDG